jgi:hypothetical protein
MPTGFPAIMPPEEIKAATQRDTLRACSLLQDPTAVNIE